MEEINFITIIFPCHSSGKKEIWTTWMEYQVFFILFNFFLIKYFIINFRYDFNDSDLECTLMMTKMFLEEKEEIPWEALQYIIGQINYGGRVTDDLDRRCIMSILSIFINKNIFNDQYSFCKTNLHYHMPSQSYVLDDYRQYLRNLPTTESPELFGMHSNAEITFQFQVLIFYQLF